MRSDLSERDHPKHPIQVVSRRTNLSVDVLRAWERRYQAVRPARSPSGRRLYSDGEIERLNLLRRATQGGRSIAQVARLAADELEALVSQDEAAEGQVSAALPRLSNPRNPDEYLALATTSVENGDANGLRDVLVASGAALEPRDTIEHVIVPLLRTVSEEWSHDDSRLAHQHLAMALVQAVRDQGTAHT